MKLLYNKHHDDAPADAVYIGRPGPWSNPWPIDTRARDKPAERQRVIQLHKNWVAGQPFYRHAIATELADLPLQCYCAPLPCHGETLLEIVRENPPHPVFVFGSNTRGRHGAGAARFAVEHHGAVEGVDEGPTGNAYALPTRTFNAYGEIESLPFKEVEEIVKQFLGFTRLRKETTFMVTRVGCGLAGFDDRDIAPLFFEAGANVLLPGRWEAMRNDRARVIIAGSRSLEKLSPSDREHVLERIDKVLSRFDPGKLQIVSGCAAGADRIGEEWCISRGVLGNGEGLARFPAQWRVFGKRAGYLRNEVMSWYGAQLLALWDGTSPGTQSMIELAHRDGLAVRTLRIDMDI